MLSWHCHDCGIQWMALDHTSAVTGHAEHIGYCDAHLMKHLTATKKKKERQPHDTQRTRTLRTPSTSSDHQHPAKAN